MSRYIIISIVSGVLFGIMDAVINANPLAQRLFAVYQPIARTTVNATAGIAIDLLYGFVMAGVFLLLHASLPGGSGLVKGLSFGLLIWFFRVVMYTATQWMMFEIPAQALLYGLLTGLAEMLILGVLYGLTLQPAA
ncbi:MAG: hypothetical protein QNJ45_28505 [Ardenticatenaceae bacterium]|nr:hypothetical protein [Ardenticatenaceae bacterium]